MDAAGLGMVSTAQDTQIPHSEQLFHDLVIDVAVILIPQLRHNPRHTVLWMVPRDSLQDGQQVSILLIGYLLLLVIIPG